MNKRKIRYDRVMAAIAIAIAIASLLYLYFDFMKYPEQYLTTWKYHLENNVKNGDTRAVEYYISNYIENDKKLFEEEILMELGTIKVTAYCSCEKCCGEWSDGYTATMTKPVEGRTVAIDPNVVPLGTEIIIGGKSYIAEDTGVKGKKIDVYINSHERYLAFGVQYKDVYIKG